MNKLLVFFYALRTLLFPKKIEFLLKLGDSLCRLPAFQKAAAQAQKDPELNALILARYLGPHPMISELEQYERGTLGHEYVKFLRQNAITPYAEFSPKPEVSEHADYLKERARYTHDIAHVVLGLTTDLDDEAALNAFLLAQVPSPISALIVAGCILRTGLIDPAALSPMLNKVSKMWQEGKRSRTFLSIRWEEHWNAPLSELRLRLAAR